MLSYFLKKKKKLTVLNLICSKQPAERKSCEDTSWWRQSFKISKQTAFFGIIQFKETFIWTVLVGTDRQNRHLLVSSVKKQ